MLTDFNDMFNEQGPEAVKREIDRGKPVQDEAVVADAVIPPDAKRPARDYALTEMGAGELYADRFRSEVAFVTGIGWLTWAKTHWQPDPDKIAVMARTKVVAHEFLAEAKWAVDHNDARAKDFAHFAIGAQRLSFRRSVVEAAKSEPGIERKATELDRDPMLLNLRNGTLDLRTGKLRPHNPADLITRVAPYDYDPDAKCPRFEQFLIEVLPDAETIEFMWRFMGYCLTASVEEEVFVFCYGAGANGKTKLAEVFKEMLGPYAVTAPMSLLMVQRHARHECEMMPLMGARLATFSEIPSGQRFDQKALKSLNGGDEITARWICGNPVTFRPTHKTLILGNHLPDLQDTEEAMRRRCRLVPFERIIPEVQRDPHLAEKLRVELPGILAWAVRGCLAWQRDRLGQPAKVRTATDDYMTECDRLVPFIEERCEEHPDNSVTRAALRSAYEEWAEDRNRTRHERPLSNRDFARKLRLRGITDTSVRVPGKASPVDGWKGIALLDCSVVGSCREHLPKVSSNSSSRERPAHVTTSPYGAGPTDGEDDGEVLF
jgi:putative DNA primase/helicase